MDLRLGPVTNLQTLADIPSARAEGAEYTSNQILAEFRTRWDLLPESSSERHNLARDALFQLVTIAEMFAGEHLVDTAEQRLPDDDIVLRIWDERMPRIVRDWTGRKQGWNELFDVTWTYGPWSELNGFITARNIIAHGMGQLTRSQLRRGQIKQSVTDALRAAKLTLRGHELVPDDVAVERCAKRVRHFIAWLDDESRKALTL